MTDSIYPPSSPETAEKRRSLAPETEKAFQAFSKQVFAGGAYAHSTVALTAMGEAQHTHGERT